MESVPAVTTRYQTFVGRFSPVLLGCNLEFYRAFGLLMAVIVPTTILLSGSVHLGGLGQLVPDWPGDCLMGGCILYIHWRPLPKLIQPAHLALITILTTGVLSLLVQVAGRSPYPLVDRQLAALDYSVHFRTVDIVHFVSACPVLRVGLSLTYLTVALLIIASVVVPPLLGHAERSYRFILAVIVGIMLTVVLFYRWPAVGPWTVEGYAPAPNQAAVAEYLTRLRSKLPVLIDMKNAGIVSFPSFHVVLAILSAYALNCVRGLRWFVWSLCILICISTITTGWHYGIDVIAGMVVAAVSITLVRWMVRQPQTAA